MIHKEFNAESYHLRYANCWAPYLHVKENRVEQFFSHNIGMKGGHMSLIDTEGGEKVSSIEVWHPFYVSLEPGYYPVSSFKSKPGHSKYRKFTEDLDHICVRRRMTKTYRQAFCSETYQLFAPGAVPMVMDMVVPLFVHNNQVCKPELVINIEKAIEEGGLIDDKFYLTKDALFFMDTVVGARVGKKLIVKRNYHHEVSECLSSTKLEVSPY